MIKTICLKSFNSKVDFSNLGSTFSDMVVDKKFWNHTCAVNNLRPKKKETKMTIQDLKQEFEEHVRQNEHVYLDMQGQVPAWREVVLDQWDCSCKGEWVRKGASRFHDPSEREDFVPMQSLVGLRKTEQVWQLLEEERARIREAIFQHKDLKSMDEEEATNFLTKIFAHDEQFFEESYGQTPTMDSLLSGEWIIETAPMGRIIPSCWREKEEKVIPSVKAFLTDVYPSRKDQIEQNSPNQIKMTFESHIAANALFFENNFSEVPAWKDVVNGNWVITTDAVLLPKEDLYSSEWKELKEQEIVNQLRESIKQEQLKQEKEEEIVNQLNEMLKAKQGEETFKGPFSKETVKESLERAFEDPRYMFSYGKVPTWDGIIEGDWMIDKDLNIVPVDSTKEEKEQEIVRQANEGWERKLGSKFEGPFSKEVVKETLERNFRDPRYVMIFGRVPTWEGLVNGEWIFVKGMNVVLADSKKELAEQEVSEETNKSVDSSEEQFEEEELRASNNASNNSVSQFAERFEEEEIYASNNPLNSSASSPPLPSSSTASEKLATILEYEPSVEYINSGTLSKLWLTPKGLYHRIDGPAVIRKDGTEEWWVHGVSYTKEEFEELSFWVPEETRYTYKWRAGGQDLHNSATKEGAFVDSKGNLHRLDGPAQCVRDYKGWHKHGNYHRIGAPARSWDGGSTGWGEATLEEWYVEGLSHREDGPAIVFSHKPGIWRLEGKTVTEEEVLSRARGKKSELIKKIGQGLLACFSLAVALGSTDRLEELEALKSQVFEENLEEEDSQVADHSFSREKQTLMV